MQVSTIIDYIAKGDLKQTSLSDIGTADVRTAAQQSNLDTLIGFVNQGVLELHKRFPIKIGVEEELIRAPTPLDDPIVMPNNMLELVGVTTYDKIAVPTSDMTTGGYVVPIDDYDTEWRYYNEDYKGIYVKTVAVNSYLVLGWFPENGVKVAFRYKAAPELVRYNSALPLPMMYQEALMNYIAYRGYSSIPSVTPAGDTGLMFKKKFEDSCLRIEQNTDTLYEWANPKRLSQRGFV